MDNITHTTVFHKDDGSVSSIRTTQGNMKNGISFTSYVGNSARGGVTFHNRGISSRFNKNGQSMGVGNSISGIKPF